jgi:hypothetical protein
MDIILSRLVGEWSVQNPQAAMPDPGRPLVWLIAHGPLTAPTALMGVIGKTLLDKGMDDLVVAFYPHPLVLKIPLFGWFYERLGTATQLYDVERLALCLKTGKVHAAGTAPESVNCNFSWTEYVAPFHTGGMLAAAILADADICLLAHLGGELWNIRANLPFGLTVPFTRGLRGVNVPLPPVRRIPRYLVSCERYTCPVKSGTFSRLDAKTRRGVLAVEMEKVRNRLLEMTRALAAEMEKA